MFKVPETFMMDGGTHFNNGDVQVWCEANGTSHQVVAAYAPWVNGLVENANGKLLGQGRVPGVTHRVEHSTVARRQHQTNIVSRGTGHRVSSLALPLWLVHHILW